MSLWAVKIVTRGGMRDEIIDGKENLLNYIDRDLLEKGEVGIVIQRRIPKKETPLPRAGKSQKKPWWKFW